MIFEVFEHPLGDKSPGDQLLMLCQGKESAAEYAQTFRTLAAETNWVEDTLKLLYRKGLSLELQAEIACRDEGLSLNEFIELEIQTDNLICSRRPFRGASLDVHTHNSELMQLGHTPLTSGEREC